MDAEEDGDAVVAVGHVGGHALLQEETESGADTRCSHEQKKLLSDSRAAARCSHALHDCRSGAFLVFMTLSLVSCKLNCDPQEHQWLHLKTSLHALPFYLNFFSISRTEMFADCTAKLNMFLLSAEHVFSLSPEDSA